MSNLELVKDLYDNFGRGDVPAVLAGFTPNMSWTEAENNPYFGGTWKGGDAVVQNLFTKLASEWDGFSVSPQAFHDAGDSIAVEGRYTGTFKQTGKSIDAQFCHIWKINDGKLSSFQQYTDTAQFQEVVSE